jgi:hypothetical protein
MWPYFIFNPILKIYMFFPDGDIYYYYPTHPETINITTFYEIFDGFYHVVLNFNITVMKLKGLNPLYLKYLLTINDNTAPIFVFGKRNYPVLYMPKFYYYADLPKMKSTLPDIWDKENDAVKLSYDLEWAGVNDFASLRKISKDKYLFEAMPLS